MNATRGETHGTASRATRVLGALTLAGTAAVAYLGLVATGPDVVQRDAVRLIYVHVPMVSVMYVPVAMCSIASLLWLRQRSDGWDALAVASAEVATLFVGLGLLTGAVWGRPTWGVYWTWDARLTSTAMLFILLLGYLTMRRLPDERTIRTRRAAIVKLGLGGLQQRPQPGGHLAGVPGLGRPPGLGQQAPHRADHVPPVLDRDGVQLPLRGANDDRSDLGPDVVDLGER